MTVKVTRCRVCALLDAETRPSVAKSPAYVRYRAGSSTDSSDRAPSGTVPATADGLTGDGPADVVVRDGTGVGLPTVGAAMTPGTRCAGSGQLA